MCQNKRFHISELIEGVDFYWEEVEGIKLRVFTEDYLRMVRIKCCENSCKNCPWGFKKKNLSIN
jgi:hypothetical protein